MMQRFEHSVHIVGCIFVGCVSSRVVAQKIYWADAGAQLIRRANLDGSFVEDLRTGVNLRSPYNIAIDSRHGKMYWSGNCGIHRANVDGSEMECIVPAMIIAWRTGVALDLPASKVYWTAEGGIQRANLDGTGLESVPLADPAVRLVAIAVDSEHGKMYWSEEAMPAVRRANLDGSQIETLFNGGPFYPRSLAVDPAAGKLYGAGGGVFRVNLDGTGLTNIGGDTTYATAIAIDPEGQKVYWDKNSGIVRTNLNGTQLEVFIPYVFVTGIALDPKSRFLFWTSSGPALIHRAPLDEASAEELIGLDLVPQDLALDLQRGRMFWIDHDRYRIRAADLDGSNPVVVVPYPRVASPNGLATDPVDHMLYWTDDTGGVHRAGQDGSNPTKVIGVTHPLGIVIDSKARTMYGARKQPAYLLFRAHLNGSDRASSRTRLSFGFGLGKLALDRPGGHLYWTVSANIQRGALDFSTHEDFLSARAADIASDEEGRWLYWSDAVTPALRRTKLDGSVTEELPISDLVGPVHIALDLRRPGDFDYDDRVDLSDFARFQNCFAGAGVRPSDPACGFFDVDPADGDVDEPDFGALSRVINSE